LTSVILCACGGAPVDPTNANAANAPTIVLTTAGDPTAPLAPTDSGSTAVAQAVTPTPDSGSVNASDSGASGAAAADAAALVNGQAISLDVFERAVARSAAGGASYPDETARRADVLDTLIQQVVIAQAAAGRGLTVDEAALDAEVASYVTALGGAAAWADWLAANFYTEAEFRETLRDSLLTNQLRDAITADLSGDVPQVRARHILVATEGEARAILARLDAGESFESLAAAASLDVTTQARGGDLGWFVAEELLEPALAQLAFALPDNGIAGPVQTALGYHIIQTLEHATRPIPPEKMPVLAQLRFESWLADVITRSSIERLNESDE
jgi:parvulin-like peptidyl-prolyl isomerase